MDWVVLTVFAIVYLGMIAGGLPGLRIDRTGVALLGAIALVATRRLTLSGAAAHVDIGTLALLFGLMVVSAQLKLSGFYAALTRRIAARELAPQRLLLLVVLAAGALSALLTNDVICLAMAPILVEGCVRRRLHPLPFLLALACATNVGSAATLIGNPQNMLIGQHLRLDFARYALIAIAPSALGLLVVWAWIAWSWRGRFEREMAPVEVPAQPLLRDQTLKGLALLLALAVCFLATPWPRELLALAGAGLLLLSRRMASRELLALVDWPLLVLFTGLFIVNGALQDSGWLERGLLLLRERGFEPEHPAALFAGSVIGGNIVSNVPAVMLLLPSATHPLAGPVLALASTLAGNLLLVGSIANLIVADQAGRLGIAFGWREHARVGIPITLATCALAAATLVIAARLGYGA